MHDHRIDTIIENILNKLLNRGKPDDSLVKSIQYKLNNQKPHPNTSLAYDDHLDPHNTIGQLANLRRNSPQLFTPKIEKLIKNGNYQEALNSILQKESTEHSSQNTTFQKWYDITNHNMSDIPQWQDNNTNKSLAWNAYSSGYTNSDFEEEWLALHNLL